MIRVLTKHRLLAVEVVVAVGYFAVAVRPEAEWGGGTVPIVALLLAATSVALHRVQPGFALAALAAEVLVTLAFGYGGRSPTIWIWVGAPLVLFSAAFFGGRITRALALAAGVSAWLVISARDVELFRNSYPDFGVVPVIMALEVRAPAIILTAAALVAPPILGVVLHRALRRPRPQASAERGVSPTLAEYASSVSLTTREQRVFELAAQGLTNAEIAAAEHVSEATVKSQMTRVLAKAGARDRVQLAIDAHRRGRFDAVR